MKDDIKRAWGWIGAEPKDIVSVNKFGNIIFTDNSGRVWRLSPEDLLCTIIANNTGEFAVLSQSKEFTVDWSMDRLVALAEEAYGIQPEGRCFCLKTPSSLGGEYSISTIGTISIAELISFSGNLANQIHELPDGAWVRLEAKE